MCFSLHKVKHMKHQISLGFYLIICNKLFDYLVTMCIIEESCPHSENPDMSITFIIIEHRGSKTFKFELWTTGTYGACQHCVTLKFQRKNARLNTLLIVYHDNVVAFVCYWTCTCICASVSYSISVHITASLGIWVLQQSETLLACVHQYALVSASISIWFFCSLQWQHSLSC